MLVERTTVATGTLPVTEFKDHLRLGTGFADDAIQDSVLESYLRSAIAAIEARTGKILIQRGYTWTLTRWRETTRQALPIAPVAAITEVKLVDRDGGETTADPSTFRLAPDTQRPCLLATGVRLPLVPNSGSVEIQFDAGFAST